jgi:hypothetical protein
LGSAFKTSLKITQVQGCQMFHLRTKNYNSRIFWKALEWKLLVYFMAIGMFMAIGIFYGQTLVCSWLLVYFTAIWLIGCGNVVYFSSLGIFYQDKSGNPDALYM